MRVSGLDKNNDWRFGRGRALYITGSAAIRQNVITRIKSFKYDWALDQQAGIDWIDLLGRRGTRNAIEREIERVTLATIGVVKINNLSLVADRSTRRATIMLSFQDIYDAEFNEQVVI